MRRNVFFFMMVILVSGAVFAAEKQSGPAFKSVSLGSATLTRVYPRIFTPNDDGKNDVVLFEFDNPAVLPIKGEVFDSSGARAGTLSASASAPDTTLTWDGKRNGRALPSGTYIYKVQVGDRTASGAVVLAR